MTGIAIAEQKAAREATPWRILMLTANDGYAQRYAHELARRLRARDWHVSTTVQFPRLIGRHRPHIIHYHAPQATLAVRAARLLGRVPVVVGTLHTEENSSWSGRAWARLTEPLNDATTFACSEAAQQLSSLRPASSKLAIIPPGVDLARFNPDREARRQTREALTLGPCFVWLSTTRFYPLHDHHTLIRAFALVVKHRPSSVLLLAGDGPLRADLKDLAQSLGMEPHVRFLCDLSAARWDTPALMNAADAYVLSSLSEDLPPELLEAGAAHLPIVTTDVGGTASVVNHGVTGLAAPPANPEALADTMLNLTALSNHERRQLAQNAFAHVSRNNDLEHVTSQWERLYRELLTRKGLRP